MNKRIIHKLKVGMKNVIGIPYKLKHHISLRSITQDSTTSIKSKIYPKCKFYRSSLGKYSYIGEESFVSDAVIGNFTSIAQNCYIGGAAHPLDRVTTSYYFYCTDKESEGSYNPFYQYYFSVFKKTYIGNDVWIGAHSIILAGVKINDGAVIGAGSVVTKDVPPFEIWAGNPAKFIRRRFDESTIDFLMKVKWWEWNDETIVKYSKTFDSPERLCNQLKNTNQCDQ